MWKKFVGEKESKKIAKATSFYDMVIDPDCFKLNHFCTRDDRVREREKKLEHKNKIQYQKNFEKKN